MSDARIRDLERTAILTGTTADITAWLVEGERCGHPAGAAWRAFEAEVTEAEFRRQHYRDAMDQAEGTWSAAYRYGRRTLDSSRASEAQHERGRREQAARLTAAGRALLSALPRTVATSWALQLSPLATLVKRLGWAVCDHAVNLLATDEIQGLVIPDKQPECMSTLRGGRRRCRGVASSTLLFAAPGLGAAHVCSAHVACPGVWNLFRTLDGGLWDSWAAGDVERCTYFFDHRRQAPREGLHDHAVLLYPTARFPVLQPKVEARGRLLLQTIWS